MLIVGAAMLLIGAGKRLEEPPLRGFAKPDVQPVKVELISEHASLQPGGMTHLGVHFELESGWHIYAQDPGDAGLPTTVAWSAPAEVSIGPLRWPPAQEFLDPGDIHTFGFSGMLVLTSPVTVAAHAAHGSTILIQADVSWMACKELCIPDNTRLELSLPVLEQPPALSTHAEFFDQVH